MEDGAQNVNSTIHAPADKIKIKRITNSDFQTLM